MSKAILEFMVSVRGEEAPLHEICDRISTTDPNHLSELSVKLTEAIKTALESMSEAGELSVEINKGYVDLVHTAGGGLSAQAWLESDRTPADTEESRGMEYQD